MTGLALLQYAAFIVVVTLLVKPLGGYMARVFSGEATRLDVILKPLERGIYRCCGIDPSEEMSWRRYSLAFILFSFAGTILLYAILRLEPHLPWYDKTIISGAPTADLAMNTAISFATTTTWQAYAGETTMSYFAQIVGLAGQNFLAGAGGLAVGIAFIRGFARKQSGGIGNFWMDLTRATLWVLLPASLLCSLVLIWQGVPMNFLPYTHAATLEGAQQVIAQGPVAALESIKNLGTNGGGFFNANGAHPFENPTPLTNFLEMLAIVALPAALTHTYGKMIGRPRQGWAIYGAMTMLFIGGLALCHSYEQAGNPLISHLGVLGGNMEGKETRFGLPATILTATVTSNGATGSTNAMHDSLTPLGGMIPLVNMLLGEMVYGGLGTGIYSFIMVALLALFLACLMVGRSPQYLDKRVGPREIKLVMLYTLAAPIAILAPTALAVVLPAGLAGLTTNTGPHGFSEILYAYASCFANNGQSFGGLSGDSPFFNISTAFSMMVGRFALAVPALALAGSFAAQSRRAETPATLPTDTLQFATLTIATAIIAGGLSFLPALALGPIVEHLILHRM